MKPALLLPTLFLLGANSAALLAADPDPKPAPPPEAPSDAEPAVPAKPGQIRKSAPAVSGHAVVEIDVNGKKEKREFNIGNGTTINITGGSETSTPKSLAPRTWLGVASEGLSDDVRAQLPLAEGVGLIVRSVVSNSPAAQAGLAMNDVLVKLDDQILVNPEQLRALIVMKKPDDTVRVTYLRRGHEESVQVKLGSHEGGDAGERKWKLSDLFGKEGTIDLKNLWSPTQIETKAVVIDKDGNVISSATTGDVSAAAAKVAKALRDAGVDAKAIEQTVREQVERALKEAADAVQKGAADGAKPNDEVSKQIQEKIQEKLRAIREARKEAEPKSQPAPPVEKAP